MSEMPKSRAERRELQREQRRDFESLAKQVRASLDNRQDDDFKMAIVTALQKLELCGHPNALIGVSILIGCVECEARDDGAAARLLLYIAGVIIEPSLTLYALQTLMSAQQMVQTAIGKRGLPSQ